MSNQSRRAARAAALAAAALVAATAAACSGSSSGGAPGGGSGGASGASGTPANASAAGSSSAAAAYPLTIRAADGPVTLAARPTAIVSLSPTATETLFAIGAGSQVKAVDKDSDYPPNAPHTSLDAYQLNTEAVAGYRPDLVVASNLTSAQLAQLRTLHIPTLLQPAPQNLGQAYTEITQLGQATGNETGAARLVATMKRQIATIVRSVARPAHPQTYYYELDQTYYSVTSDTFVGRLLGMLGLKSIADAAKGAAASGGYPQLSAEFILKANPDYVLLADTRCCKQSPVTVARRPGWSALSAVQGGRIIPLDDDIASRWGPRIVDLLRTVADAIRRHPAPARP